MVVPSGPEVVQLHVPICQVLRSGVNQGETINRGLVTYVNARRL